MVTIQDVLSLGRATRLKGMKIPRQFDFLSDVEEHLYANPIELERKIIDYKFVDSKEEPLVQVSDLIVGVLRYWMAFLESVSIYD